MLVSVITPVYNRSELLLRIYNSLVRQSCQDFEWIIINDGSTDNIDVCVSGFISNDFPVSYYKKNNGGKHTALNVGISKAVGELILILDSDDFLVDNAISIIAKRWEKYRHEFSVAGLSFLKCDVFKRVVGDLFLFTDLPINNIKMRYFYNIIGDKCEVFRKDVLEKYKFPEFENEKFISECIVWNKIAEKFDMVYFNDAIYVCEYLEEGLSCNIRSHFYKNPLGVAAMENGKTIKLFPFRIRLLGILQYISYSLLAKKHIYNMYIDCRNKVFFVMLYPIGFLLFVYKYYRIKFNRY